jgi:hypothetical protein
MRMKDRDIRFAGYTSTAEDKLRTDVLDLFRRCPIPDKTVSPMRGGLSPRSALSASRSPVPNPRRGYRLGREIDPAGLSENYVTRSDADQDRPSRIDPV